MVEKINRLTLAIDHEDYKKLKVKLIMQDKSVSQWIKEQIQKEISTKK